MRIRVTAGIMAGLLVAAWAGAGEDAAKADHKKMKGQWQLKSEIKDGEERPAEVVKSVKLTFDGTGGWVLKKDDEVLFQGTSKANPSRSPKQLDLTLSAPEENKGLQIQAIYELKGDTFRICWTINGERPTEFEAKDSSGRTYSVFKRAKAK